MKFAGSQFHFSSLIIPFLLLFAIGLKPSDLYPERKTQPDKKQDEWVETQLSKLSLREKIAQSFMIACRSNEDERYLAGIEREVRDNKIGGIIFFQGERGNLMNAIDRFQNASAVPLLMGMDAEWGVAMRISGEERFPYAQAIGAADDAVLTEKIGFQMGVECNQLGIHMSFAPVADVNSNPKNPVIGFRSFGSDPNHVAKHVNALVRGMESTSVISCVKHFPGHGDTDKDSHLELPVVSHTKEQFESSDFIPFRAGIAAGTGSIMVAHLSVPALDPSGTPSSLSKPVIQDYLRKDLGFKGLVISDALNMKAVSERYGKAEVVAKAYSAGCDILLYPESVSEAIELIEAKTTKGEITLAEVNEHCRQVLRAKYKAIVGKPMVKRPDQTVRRDLAVAQVYEKALTVIKNDSNLLPLDRLDKKIALISIGINTGSFAESLSRFSDFQHYHYFTAQEALSRMAVKDFSGFDVVLLAFHASSQRAANNYDFREWQSVVNALPAKCGVSAVFFGNPGFLNEQSLPANLDACMLAYENHPVAQERAGQMIVGAIGTSGKLRTSFSDAFRYDSGVMLKSNGRLKYTVPEELGIASEKLSKIDEIAENAVRAHVFPGCQVVVAVKGKIIYRRSFGTTMYGNGDTITNDHLYDIASVTKVASSTVSLMKLASEGKFDVDKTLGELIPEKVEGTRFAKLKAVDMLTHQAGLTPWIAFYKSTVKNGQPDPLVYSKTKKEGFSTPVAKDLWIADDYRDQMYRSILASPLDPGKGYEYSDLGYYFFNPFIGKAAGIPQDQYVQKEIYAPLGLRRITYLPLQKFPLSMIVPTEFDKEFRQQVVHGYVHDPGAAMLGGVAGHAGIFANATDLAAVMQLLLNKGQIGDQSIIDPKIVMQYTACQFCPKNRRAIGFDRPVQGGGGPATSLASQQSFGHSGFTGTLVWADPAYDINYVFLSNRVYPDADNWKIRDMGIRTEIQKVIYEAVLSERTAF
jgi:beta-N-acetylhexosaminidase